MTTPTTDEFGITEAVTKYYQRWVEGVRQQDAELARQLPTFDGLSAEQMAAWQMALAANLELGGRLGHAIAVTMP